MIVYIKLVLLCVFIAITNPSSIDRLGYLCHKFGPAAGILYGVAWTMSGIGLLAGACIANRFWRFVIGLLVSASTYFYLVNNAISSTSVFIYSYLEMLINARSAFFNAVQYYAYYMVQFKVVGVVLIGFLGFLLPVGSDKGRWSQLAKKTKTLLGVYCLPIAMLLGITMLTIHKTEYGLNGMMVQYIPQSHSVYYMLNQLFGSTSWDREFPDSVVHQRMANSPKHIILIIDESVRADYLNKDENSAINLNRLGYKNHQFNFGSMVSGMNVSDYSKYFIRVGARPGQPQMGTNRHPFIWQYAKQAGYKTIYIDNQHDQFNFQNFMTLEEKSWIDMCVFPREVYSNLITIDHDSLDIVDTLMDSPTPLFIVLLKNGVHFPYDQSISTHELSFFPNYTQGSVLDRSKQSELINSYKNAIQLIIDPFFAKLDTLDLSNAVVLYTSDHGQNLLDTQSVQTHGSLNNPSVYEGLVPFIVFSDHPKWVRPLRDAVRLNYNALTHFSIYPTLLMVMGYQNVSTAHGETIFEHQQVPYAFLYSRSGLKTRVSFFPSQQQPQFFYVSTLNLSE